MILCTVAAALRPITGTVQLPMTSVMQYGGYGPPQQHGCSGYGLDGYDGDDDDGGYGGQVGPPRYGAPQDYSAPVLWGLHPWSGVAGFPGVDEKYFALPYALRAGDQFVLSRWNMLQQRLTVSRIQAIAQANSDGTATLTSHGRGPTLWRAHGGPWNALYSGQRKELQGGDQVSLDCNEPEAAVFTCLQESATPHHGYDQGYGDQQGYYAGNQYGSGYGYGGQQSGYPQQGLW